MADPNLDDPVDRGAPFASVLHAATIEKLARGAAMVRGRAYVDEGRVVSLVRNRTRLAGQVRGSSTYEVSIWVSGVSLGYSCSCPQGVEGEFCKHCVAVTLSWVSQNPPASGRKLP